MNKLGLVGLFAAGAMFVVNVQKHSNDKRDAQLMKLAQALYDEDFSRSEAAILVLAKEYAHQPTVRQCLINALDDVLNIFGDARGLPLLQTVEQATNSRTFNQILAHVRKDFRDLRRDQAKSHDKAVRVMSEFLHRVGLPQMDFGEGSVGIKRRAVSLRGDYMTPEQFLNRNDAPTVAAAVQKLSYRAG